MDEKELLSVCRGITGHKTSINHDNGIYIVENKKPSRIGRWFRQGVAGALIAASAFSAPLYAAEKTPITQTETPKLELKGVEEYVRKNLDVIVPRDKEWERTVGSVEEKLDKAHGQFLLLGACQYHSSLSESESQIKPLNDVLKVLSPNSQSLTTFKDYEERGFLADSFVGYGRDLGKNFSVWADIGGGYAKIKNHRNIHPLDVDIDFTRWDVYAELCLDYYPFGKTDPEFTKKGILGRIEDAVSQAKPSISVTGGYSYQGSVVDIKIKGLVGKFKIEQKDGYGIFYVTPHFNIDFPISERNDLMIGVGYAFANEHQKEINGPAVLMALRHRF